MPKLYAYVDESGQGSNPFAVAVVIAADDRDSLAAICERIEKESEKGAVKWSKANYERRLMFMRAIVNDSHFSGALCFGILHQVDDYDAAMVAVIGRAIERADPLGAQRVTIFVDGLSDKKKREYAPQLRQRVRSLIEIRGVKRDQNNPLVRLADAVAGFVIDAYEEDSADVVKLFERAQRTGVLLAV